MQPSLVRAASVYEQVFVPALFQEWAPRVAAAARVGPAQRVLDVGCGTGVLARELARRVGAEGSVAGVDVNPGMLAVAARSAPGIEWREAAAESLPWSDGDFDAVVSQFALMFFADREQAVHEMLRVLRPGGRLGVAVWDALERTPAYAAEVELLERVSARAGAVLRAPFALGDPHELAALFDGAGAHSVAIRTEVGSASFASVRAMVEADIRAWFPVVGVNLRAEEIKQVLGDAERVLLPFVARDGSGRVVFPVSAHIVQAVKPRSA